jgi:hypothetical protein
MQIPTPYQNFFTILQGGKGIPYPGGEHRVDGSINHGFRPLKGRLSEIASVHEVQDDKSLALLLEKINAPDTTFFSVGCVSGQEVEQGQNRVSGYVEFAINDKRMVADAMNYFQVFFLFTQKLANLNFCEQARFVWELLGARFLSAGCDGFTCRLIVNTAGFSTMEQAKSCWASSLGVLGDHLASIGDRGGQRIY